MKKNPTLRGVAVENITAGDQIEFYLINGHTYMRRDKKKSFRFYEKPKGKFNLKDKDMKR